MSTVFRSFLPLSLSSPIPLVSTPTPFQIHNLFFKYVYINLWIYKYSQLSQFHVAFKYMCLGLTAWNWITCQELVPGEDCFSLNSHVLPTPFLLGLGFVRVPWSMFSGHLVLSLCRICFGSQEPKMYSPLWLLVLSGLKGGGAVCLWTRTKAGETNNMGHWQQHH